MTQDTKNPYGRKAQDPSTPTSLEMVIRTRARSWIETIIDEELEDVLAAKPSARVLAPGLSPRDARAHAHADIRTTEVYLMGAARPELLKDGQRWERAGQEVTTRMRSRSGSM